jgi:hypothetical protein
LTDTAWVDEALKNARLSHRFFLGFAVTVISFFWSSVFAERPRWIEQLDTLEMHRSDVLESIGQNAEQRSHAPGGLGVPLADNQICVKIDGQVQSLLDWGQTLLHVKQLQSLVEVEVFIPVLDESTPGQCSDHETLEVDCATQVAVLQSADLPIPLRLDGQTLRSDRDGLTVMNGYEHYAAVQNATHTDALGIVEYQTKRARSGAGAGVPLISTASLMFVGLTMIGLMLHLIFHMNRLREMAIAGHCAQLLGFPWIVTMNSPWARRSINLLTLVVAAAVPCLGTYDYAHALLTHDNTYVSPETSTMVVLLSALGFTVWMFWSQKQLQDAVPLQAKFYDAPPPPRLRDCGTLPLATSSFRGRTEELAQLAKLGRAHVVLTGALGVGKTTLAFEFGRRNQTDHPDGVFVIDCRNSCVSALARLISMVPHPSFDSQSPIEERASAVLHTLANRSCLLIYDGVTDPQAVLPWLPPAGHTCNVLATSTVSEWPDPFIRVPINPLADDQTSPSSVAEQTRLDQ